jgi:hypothetical protein
MKRMSLAALLLTSAVLAPSAFAQPASSAPATATEAKLPSGKDVLAKYVEATGGQAAHAAIKNRITKGKVEIPSQNLKGSIVSYQDNAGRILVEVDFVGVGKMNQGSDGTTVWENNPMAGPRILSGQEADEFIRANALDADINPDKYYSSIETAGVEAIAGKDAYKVEVVAKNGDKETRFYDKESGLLVLTKGTYKSQQGEVPMENSTTDYRDAGGVKIAFRAAAKVMNFEQIVILDEALSNQEIAADKYALPAPISALLSKKTDKPAEPPAGK